MHRDQVVGFARPGLDSIGSLTFVERNLAQWAMIFGIAAAGGSA